MKDSPVESLALAVVFAGASLAAWQWQHTLSQRHPSAVTTERWEQVRELYPAPEPFRIPSDTTPETLQGIVRANPFSRERRHAPPPTTEVSAGKPAEPLPPQFVFKGRVVMGTKQRGILEDRQHTKTYFVQVGQEVVGFTVVEIAEDHVILSDAKTNETLTIPLASKVASESKPASASGSAPASRASGKRNP